MLCLQLNPSNWHTPFELLEGEKPNIEKLQVFGCGAYVHIPQVVHKDKMSPKSELMIYIGIALGGHKNIFMCSPGNVIFTAAHIEFIEKLFPCCTMRNRRLPNSNNQISPPCSDLV